ncbi:MAG: HD domain-containing protein [Clostridia bacterium]|nr:HD domain-containing protein [Clostridia bacterium]
MKVLVPKEAHAFLRRLEAAGFSAFLVGGAVRDLLSGKAFSDLDIATSATPEEVQEVFSDCRVIATGLAHGTQTVRLSSGETAEITTFRTEGEYTDARHPTSVSFVKDVTVDLARRDFTVGAMALSLDGELIDPFGGREDLARGILRAVGDAKQRFREDALRILRALRLSSEHDFEIEEQTFSAMLAERGRLSRVAKERLFSEFCRLLQGRAVERVLLEGREILAELVPRMRESFEFDHRSIYHLYDVYTHTAKVVSAVENDLPLRLAAFYHDLGKPSVATEDAQGHRHFKCHAAESVVIAEESLSAFGASRATSDEVLFLIRHHDAVLFPSEKGARRALSRYGEERTRKLVALQLADAESHAEPHATKKKDELSAFSDFVLRVLERSGALSLRTLAVDGEDLKAMGVLPSEEMGRLLGFLLDSVVDGDVENEREALLRLAEKRWRHPE